MTSPMREIRTSGSVGAPGEQSPAATRPVTPNFDASYVHAVKYHDMKNNESTLISGKL